jgi:hypothetical protein
MSRSGSRGSTIRLDWESSSLKNLGKLTIALLYVRSVKVRFSFSIVRRFGLPAAQVSVFYPYYNSKAGFDQIKFGRVQLLVFWRKQPRATGGGRGGTRGPKKTKAPVVLLFFSAIGLPGAGTRPVFWSARRAKSALLFSGPRLR